MHHTYIHCTYIYNYIYTHVSNGGGLVVSYGLGKLIKQTGTEYGGREFKLAMWPMSLLLLLL